MNDNGFLNQIEHISEIFARVVLKAMEDMAGNAPDEVTMAQFEALKHIAQHGPSTIGSLAEGLSISQPAATMLVDRMAKRLLVERHPGRKDRRQAEISLTKRAQELLELIEMERTERLSRILGVMEPGDRIQLMKSLEAFVAAALKLESSIDEACLRCGSDHQADCVVNQARLELTGKSVERT